MLRPSSLYKDLVTQYFDWAGWEATIAAYDITIDRPYRSYHPRFPDIIYPLDYGFINNTTSGDGDEVDVFVGSAENGLVGVLLTTDHRKGDHEMKFLFNCSPEEIYLAHGFINFDQQLMEGTLVLRHPMAALWRAGGR